MDTATAVTGEAGISAQLDFDAIVIGAGVTGLYQLYKLRELGLRVRTGIATRAPASILKAGPMAMRFPRNCSTSGIGTSTFLPNPRTSGI
jgi:hypothetical protein